MLLPAWWEDTGQGMGRWVVLGGWAPHALCPSVRSFHQTTSFCQVSAWVCGTVTLGAASAWGDALQQE